MARLILLLVLLAAGPAQARIAEYTESETGPDRIALGYPVPQPLDSTTRFAGFRSYDSLTAGLVALTFESAEFSRVALGRSLDGRDIHGFVFGRQASGSAPAMLQLGTVHAREWAAPEAVAHIAERLVEGLAGDGLPRYLADRTRILLAPVMNPDGFVASQQAYNRTRLDEDPFNSSQQDPQFPRDGRQRRKNLRDSDGVLDTGSDVLQGVDPNRNIGRFWGTSSRSSDDPRSLVYHGSSEASEPETRAVKQAATLLGADALRLFIDTHSFSRVFFYNDTGNARLRTLTRALAEAMGRVAETHYRPVPESAGIGIGANDEYFGYEFAVPSLTLELEPGIEMQGAEYGGHPDVSHSGFILPEAEITRVREEAWLMALFAYYHQAGPPILERLEVLSADGEEPVYAARWQAQGDGRAMTVTRDGTLAAGTAYTLRLVFDKPMRWPDAAGAAGNFPGQNVTLQPAVELLGGSGRDQELGGGRWESTRYRFDSYELAFTPNAALGATARVAVSVRDLSAHALDARPATRAGWEQGHWAGYEDSDGRSGDGGGTDQQFCLRLSDTASCEAGGGGSGSPGLWLLLLLGILGRVRVMASANEDGPLPRARGRAGEGALAVRGDRP